MPGKKPHVSLLQARKELLVAESELNRMQLIGNLVALMTGVRSITDRAKSFRSIASTAAVLVAGLTVFLRGKARNAGVKPSRLQIILKGAGLVSTLWLAIRARAAEQKGK